MPVPTDPQLHSSTSAQLDESDLPLLPETTWQDIINCSFPSWHDQFRGVTFRSKTLALPSEFVDYLNADGIFLPEEGQPQAAATIEEIDDDDDDSETENSDSGDPSIKPNFPAIESFIRDAVQELGGAVFPKLTWSSPRDAAWIAATQSLKCTSPFDVFLLLKSSDFINHDLNHAFENCIGSNSTSEGEGIQHHLVLRKWQDLQPSMEFRVFIKNKEIVAISQRDLTFYNFLEGMKDDIEDMIFDFFEDSVQQVFPSTNYVMDVYVERERRKVWIVDFNPFTPATDGLLFEWSELAQLNFDASSQTDNQEPEFRIIRSEAEANTHVCNGPRFATNMIPRDVIDLSDGRTVAEFAEEFQRAMMLAESQLNDNNSTTSEDDDDDAGHNER
ncbi:D123-domain-containing protein [Zychaea mexicana]|uniref:D123-domain-containing protein n=1 Tax=Zychaea mexicana TaxID=64656 RepID=UPI0022FDEF34|nr:D123-domain-containing protein [Zychaea mexicana]KAI9496185.1 D123-domain-containing protein [Zychaea mexicana]